MDRFPIGSVEFRSRVAVAEVATSVAMPVPWESNPGLLGALIEIRLAFGQGYFEKNGLVKEIRRAVNLHSIASEAEFDRFIQ